MTNRYSRYCVLGILALILVPTGSAWAGSAREILDRANVLENGPRRWDDRTQTMTLKVTAADGAQRERHLQIFSKRYPADEEKTLSFLLGPAEMRGTGFLQWSHPNRDDEQWLYLPEFRRTRQISARLKEESFVGSDFSYRDLEIVGKILRWNEEEAATSLAGEESVGGVPCHSIELRPRKEDNPYGKILLALERDRLVVRKLSFFDRDGKAWKVLRSEEVRDVSSIPVAHRFEMENQRTGSRTLVTLDEVKHNVGLGDDLFTQRSLERGVP